MSKYLNFLEFLQDTHDGQDIVDLYVMGELTQKDYEALTEEWGLSTLRINQAIDEALKREE